MKPWIRSTWTDAGQLVAAVDRRADTALARGKPLPAWFAELRAAKRHADAAGFIAHALPRYECVMWATRTLLECAGFERSDPFVVAALRWLDDPSDGNRRAAQELADSDPDDGPGALLCNAIFLSGGSLAPADLPPVQPRPDLCAKLAVAAVLSAAYARDNPQQVIDQSLSLGETIASGG